MTKVKLRTKPIKGNRQTLYLDFYPPIQKTNGKITRREFLGLYIFDKPKTPVEKQFNKETKALAQNIWAKRQLEIQSNQYGFLSSKDQDANFINYFRVLAEKHEQTTRKIWFIVLHYLQKFTGGTLRFADLNLQFCNDFKEYILKVQRRGSKPIIISQNTALCYFSKIRAALKQALKDGLLKTDINLQIERIKEIETERQFLTLDELNSLVQTECYLPVLKQAALFSALTGLRFSDIQKLVWGEVQHNDPEGYYLQFRQQKTKGMAILPISEQAYNLMGQPGNPTEKVFNGLKYNAYNTVYLKRWVLKAGITKDISFHCFRHTYATLQLSAGTDIFTISKMLGHRDLKTTMIYAKIINKAKCETTNKIKLDF